MRAAPTVRRILFDHREFLVAYVALAPLYLAPLAATPLLPAFDLPHHLAIVDALVKTGHPESPYARDFVVGFELAPFMVHLVVLRVLAAWLSIGMAAKVLVGAVVLAMPLATARLLHVARRGTLAAVLAFPLAYSMPLHYGLVAFVPALPLLIWMLAEAADEDGWRERPWRAALWLGVLSLVMFYTHLEAWGVGAVAAAAALMLVSAPIRARVLGVAALAPAAAACALYVVRTANDPQYGSRPSFVRALVTARANELAARGVLADLVDRVRLVPVHMLRGFTDRSDVVAASVLLAIVGAGVLVRLASADLRWRGFRRPTPAAGLLAVAAVAYFGLPHHAPPDAHSVYPRFAVLLGVLLIPLLPAHMSGRLKHVGVPLVGSLLAIHGLMLVQHYAAFGRELVDFERVVEASPSGAASAGLVYDKQSAVMNVEGIFTGVPAYYVVERPSPTSSTWLYYCDVPQLPCRRRNPGIPPPVPHFTYPEQFDPSRALADLNLIFVRGGPPAEQIFGAEIRHVRLIAESGRWRAFLRQ